MDIPEDIQNLSRIPEHIGVIPDGNRRWAEGQGMTREKGYQPGVDVGFELYELCKEVGVRELTLYGFTRDNTKRPVTQREAFRKACVDAVMRLTSEDAFLRVVGDDTTPMFPEELKPYTTRTRFGEGSIKVNILVNYDWSWDLGYMIGENIQGRGRKVVARNIGSDDVSRIDLIIRWGGRRRLSGFLPVQSVYADIYVEDSLWPDFRPEQLFDALRWYRDQEVTLGG